METKLHIRASICYLLMWFAFFTPAAEYQIIEGAKGGAILTFQQDTTRTHPSDDQAYTRCFMIAHETRSASPYENMDGETLYALSHSSGHPMQGCAAWHSSVRSLHSEHHATARWQAILAAEALDSPVPIVELWRNHLIGESPETIGYVLWASQRWPNRPYLARLTAHLDDESRANAEQVAIAVAALAAQARELVR